MARSRDKWRTGFSWAESGQPLHLGSSSIGALARQRRLDALEGGCDGAAAAEAQRGETVAALAATELVQQRRHDPGAARADRMAERDRAAVDVDLRPVEAELAAVGERLRGERLVDLDQVEVLDPQLELLEQLASRP